MKFRTGTKLGDRTLYAQFGDEPDTRHQADGGDMVIGMVDWGWGDYVAEALSAWWAAGNRPDPVATGLAHMRGARPEDW